MNPIKELEFIPHMNMNDLEIFLVEMTARQPHGHADLEIGILLEGSVTLFIEQEPYDLKKGDIYMINRYQIHSFSRTAENNLILAFQIHTDFYRRIHYDFAYLRFDSNIIHSGHLHRLLTAQLLSCASVYFRTEAYRELECCSILLHVLYTLVHKSLCTIASEREFHALQNSTLRINRIAEYIRLHHAERISLQDIAELEHITPCHASHVIKSALGISFQEYLNNTRFQHALQLLTQTDLSILDVCLETGFSSSRYLNQMFEKKLHCTAREYRKASCSACGGAAKQPYSKPPQCDPRGAFLFDRTQFPVEQKDKQTPVLHEPVLPASNIQKRYSFEASAFWFQKKLLQMQELKKSE